MAAKANQGNMMQVDSKLVRELAELLGETGLTEIEVGDGPRTIRVARNIAAAAPAPIYAAAPAAAPVTAAPAVAAAAVPASMAADAPTDAASNHANALKSPMVGTVYLSPEPGSPAFVKVGDSVKAGDSLLIIEAMKVMNPIAAETAGTVTAILVQDNQPVEYDQPLIVIA